MTTIVTYLGQLRTEATHMASHEKLTTDAPIDNHGKGEAFSPTDLVCAALGSCMLTVMGIYADQHHLNIEGATASITKYMHHLPRRISKIEINLAINGENIDEKHRNQLQHLAENCPVAKSLHPSLVQELTISWKS